MATFIRHGPCPKCHSRDNRAFYADGSSWCFGCREYIHGDGEETTMDTVELEKPLDNNVEDLGAWPIEGRKLTTATCELWKYHMGELHGKPCHIANYIKDGQITARKLRLEDKGFIFDGNAKEHNLYGKWLWRSEGKMIVITEGELDALSVSQAQGNKWPVVSVPKGASAALGCLLKEIEWLEGFDKIIFCFDMDKAGQDAARECASAITPGKAHIVTLPLKDPSDMLQAGRSSELVDALWNAKEWRPDGVVCGKDLKFSDVFSEHILGYSTPYPELDAKIRGIRKRELTLLCASSGVGKSTLSRELGYHFHHTHGLKVANIYLEERQSKTAQGYIAIHIGMPLGLLRATWQEMNQANLEKAFDETINNDRMFFHNHFGSLESKKLLNRIRYFAKGVDVDFIIIDHISIAISGMESSREGERKDIDKLMTALRSLIEETGVGVIAISHLKRTDGKSFSAGAEVELSDLRGSSTLEQIPDTIIAMERNQQDETTNDVSTLRVLKNREFGTTGKAGQVIYNKSTGRLESALNRKTQF